MLAKAKAVSYSPPGLQAGGPPPALAAYSCCTRVMPAPRRAFIRVWGVVTGGVSPLLLPAAPGGSKAGRDSRAEALEARHLHEGPESAWGELAKASSERGARGRKARSARTTSHCHSKRQAALVGG